ncbi:MAG: SIR2 family protein [Gelidibacter sp.]
MSFLLSYDAFLRVVKENADTNHAFLLGAGASITSGVQSAADCIWEWKKNIFITKNPNLARQYSNFKSESIQKAIQKWLDSEGIYPLENSQEEYSFYANEAYPIEEIRRKYFENLCKDKEPYIGYKILCHLAKKGLVKSVFTTNFDGLVERAAHQTGLTPIPVSLVHPQSIHRTSSSSELICVALHGDFKFGPLKNTDIELDSQHEIFVSSLKKHLYDKHLIVFGYSGRDLSLMNALKAAYSEDGGGMLFWCGYGHEINQNVNDLFEHLQKFGRKGFYIPTEGFDSSMINLAKTCFANDDDFLLGIDRLLQNSQIDKIQRTPFKLDVTEKNALLRSNLFPILLPREVFQAEAAFPENENIWRLIKESIGNKDISMVPLKGSLYGFGIQSLIRETFSKHITGEIKRTPVEYKEIKEGTVFNHLYLTTIVKGISKKFGFSDNGRNRIWNSNYFETTINENKYKVHDAIELDLFFDDKIFTSRPYAYLSINPTFQIISEAEIPKSVRFEIGKNYHENLLKGQPNVKFNDQLEKWIGVLFSNGKKLQFEYPLNSGTLFKFAISSDTMHVSLTKNSLPNYKLRLPSNFSQNKIIHHGIQYSEPRLEFANRLNSGIVHDFHPMRGLTDNRPYDYALNGNVFDPEVNLAVICPSANSRNLSVFLNRLNQPAIAGRNNPDYLLDYPGFVQAYGVPLNVPDLSSELWRQCELSTGHSTLMKTALELADSIKRNIDQLESTRRNIVIVIFIPTLWNNFTDVQTDEEKFDLHDYIKAYAAQKQIATQFIQEETLNDSLICQVNWWLSLSFYVKTYRTPWVLQGLQQDTAFVGIGYSVNKRNQEDNIVVGCSHIYNSLGQGLKYKLTKVEDCTFDNQKNPYLSYQDAYKFGTMIRELFLIATNELPKRVVIHKRTHFKHYEIRGIVDSLGKTGIKNIDLIEINYERSAKFIALFTNYEVIKPNSFPLSRGSCFLIDNYTALLWTHGIVPSVRAEKNSYFQGGKGMPVPIRVKKHYGFTNINMIATEILGLTKMNWNSFDLYSKLPATIQTSNEIARIGWLLNRFEGRTYDYRNFM